MSDPVFCLHPNAALEYRWVPGDGKHRAYGLYTKRCPDCPAHAHQVDTGGAIELMLAPWVIGSDVRA